jgi:uncharacterized phage protein (TIGR01671 family)
MEILYRGKRISDGEWVEGTCHLADDGRAYIINGTFVDACWEEIDPDTAGRYTGLRDKYGKLIFDGDIVRIAGIYFMIRWGQKHARFEMQRLRHSGEYEGKTKYFHTVDLPEGMIAGNRWDNPELMEVG